MNGSVPQIASLKGDIRRDVPDGDGKSAGAEFF